MSEIKKCVTTANRKYDLWRIDKEKNLAVRKCKCCGIDFFYPITENILNQIAKQDEAIPLLKGFLMLSLDDPNIIGYLKILLVDVFDYVEDNLKKLLDVRLYELIPYVDDENKILISNFREANKNLNTDLFIETMEYFNKVNADLLVEPVDIKKNFSK